MSALDELIAGQIRDEGPLPFAEVMRAALYDPEHGFYMTGGSAGRRGDFITSPEIGPLFGSVIARMLDAEWERLGRPYPFTVVEAGAGAGTLAVAIRAAAPECLRATRHVLVEPSPVLRARHADHLPIGDGVESVPELPDGRFIGVVLANELLDNLPVRMFSWHEGDWREVYVTVLDSGELSEMLYPADSASVRRVRGYLPTGRDFMLVPLAEEAVAWLARARARVRRGALVLFDYGDTTASLASRPVTDWLRTYRGHERGVPMFRELGTHDITCEVPVDQLPGITAEPQADWLRRHGIEELVAGAREAWHARAVTDLAAIRARSRVQEADALLDPAGLGAFWALTARIG